MSTTLSAFGKEVVMINLLIGVVWLVAALFMGLAAHNAKSTLLWLVVILDVVNAVLNFGLAAIKLSGQ